MMKRTEGWRQAVREKGRKGGKEGMRRGGTDGLSTIPRI